MQSECPVLYSPLLTSVGKREGESLHKARSPGPQAGPPATYCGSDGCEGTAAALGGRAARPWFQLQSRAACGMRSGLTENSAANTNVFKMADSVRE